MRHVPQLPGGQWIHPATTALLTVWLPCDPQKLA
jgi:hypothetical protein